jgi:hypothetical protein
VTVSARSNRALSQFWGIVLVAITAIMVVLELATAPVRFSAGATGETTDKRVSLPKTAGETPHKLLAAG